MKLKLSMLFIICVLLNACAGPKPANRYQAASAKPPAASGPIAELHRNAITALAQNKSTLAIEYLQRAIKIEPRNAFSWHYLAQSYWHDGRFSKCLAMIERSNSYSQPEDDLDRANQTLKQQCLNG